MVARKSKSPHSKSPKNRHARAARARRRHRRRRCQPLGVRRIDPGRLRHRSRVPRPHPRPPRPDRLAATVRCHDRRPRGLRCPSETLSLEFRQIDWDKNRITVPSPKTDRYEGKETRTIPLFADLRPFLQDAFDLAEPGQTYVVGGKTGDGFRAAACRKPGKWMNANLRTTFTKIIHRAGLEMATSISQPTQFARD